MQLIEQQCVLMGNEAAHLCHVHLIGHNRSACTSPQPNDFSVFLGYFMYSDHMNLKGT